jgi:hypothetical protein
MVVEKITTNLKSCIQSSSRVELPIIDHCPIIKHFFRVCDLCFILSDLECYGSATSSFTNHL